MPGELGWVSLTPSIWGTPGRALPSSHIPAAPTWAPLRPEWGLHPAPATLAGFRDTEGHRGTPGCPLPVCVSRRAVWLSCLMGNIPWRSGLHLPLSTLVLPGGVGKTCWAGAVGPPRSTPCSQPRTGSGPGSAGCRAGTLAGTGPIPSPWGPICVPRGPQTPGGFSWRVSCSQRHRPYNKALTTPSL